MAKDEVDKQFKKERKYDSKLKKIHIAAEIGAEEYLEELLAANPEDLEAVDSQGLTPLMRSTMDLTCKSAKLLISKGANLNVRDKHGNDLYILATCLQNNDMIDLLFDNNAPTSLIFLEAAFEESNSDSKYEGSDIDELDKKILLAIKLNCYEYFEKNWETIKDRVNNGIKVLPAKDGFIKDEKNMVSIPLISAVCHLSIETIITLIKLGTDINVKGKYFGDTSLHVAVEENNLNIVKLLLNANAKIEIENFKGKTPLAVAIELRKKLEDNGGDKEELKKNMGIINMLKSSSNQNINEEYSSNKSEQ